MRKLLPKELRMTIYDESLFGTSESRVVVFTGTKENIDNVEAACLLKINSLDASKKLNKEYKYNSLDIVENEDKLSGTIVVPTFSKAKKIPKVLANLLEVDCKVSEEKTGFFSEKIIKFEAQGDKPALDALNKYFSSI